MAHTCGFCGVHVKLIVAPTADGDYETVREDHKTGTNHRYSHDIRSWKNNTRARRQWDRHRR